MKIWTVGNLKGGVGKTTTALTLAGLAASRGLRVVLLDLDPHCSLTSFFLREQQNVEHGSFDFFANNNELTPFNFKHCLLEAGHENLKLIPASPALASVDRQPSGKDGVGLLIKSALEMTTASTDLVIIDGPPMAGVLMVNAIVACQQLIIPVQTDYLGVQGLRRMLDTLKLIADLGYQDCWHSLIVPTLFDRRTHASLKALEDLREEFGNRVWTSQIAIDTKFREATALGQLPHLLHEECSGVNAYRSLLDTLLAVDKQATNAFCTTGSKPGTSA